MKILGSNLSEHTVYYLASLLSTLLTETEKAGNTELADKFKKLALEITKKRPLKISATDKDSKILSQAAKLNLIELGDLLIRHNETGIISVESNFYKKTPMKIAEANKNTYFIRMLARHSGVDTNTAITEVPGRATGPTNTPRSQAGHNSSYRG